MVAYWLCFLTILISGHAALGGQPPNIIFILADDLGWNDVSFHGSNQIPTPNIDALAYDGIIFDNYYVQPICSPSRAALLTSRYPIHLGLQHGVINGCRRYGLGLNETIMPQYLKELGYSTHGLGKPGGYGLDLHYNNELVKDKYGVYSTNMFTDSAVDIIQKHNTSQPLFIYFAEQAVHAAPTKDALEAPYQYIRPFRHTIKNKNRRTFAGMLSALDESVANLTRALHERDMLNNTIIVFSTDNGGPVSETSSNCANNWPLRGEKTTLWEGGVRGTSFLWSPALMNTPRVSKQLMHITDWLPTLLNAAGYDMKKLVDKPLDGVDMWLELVGDLPSKRKEVLLNIDPVGWDSAVRVGNYKVHVHGHNKTSNWFPLPTVSDLATDSMIDKEQRDSTVLDMSMGDLYKSSEVYMILRSLGRNPTKGSPLKVKCGPKPANATWNCDFSSGPCLYNIIEDPCEYNNIAADRPDILRYALERLQAYNTSMVPMKNKPYDPAGLPMNNDWAFKPWVKTEK